MLEEGGAVQWSCASCFSLNLYAAPACARCGVAAQTYPGDTAAYPMTECKKEGNNEDEDERDEGGAPLLEVVVHSASGCHASEVSPCRVSCSTSCSTACSTTDGSSQPLKLRVDEDAAAKESASDSDDDDDASLEGQVQTIRQMAHRKRRRAPAVGTLLEVFCEDGRWHLVLVRRSCGRRAYVTFEPEAREATPAARENASEGNESKQLEWEELVFPDDREVVRPPRKHSKDAADEAEKVKGLEERFEKTFARHPDTADEHQVDEDDAPSLGDASHSSEATAALVPAVGTLVEILCDDGHWRRAQVRSTRGRRANVVFCDKDADFCEWEELVYPDDNEVVRVAGTYIAEEEAEEEDNDEEEESEASSSDGASSSGGDVSSEDDAGSEHEEEDVGSQGIPKHDNTLSDDCSTTAGGDGSSYDGEHPPRP